MDYNEQKDYEIPTPKPQVTHILISRRDSVSNDLQNSTWQGIASFCLSVFGLVLLFLTIYYSYLYQGNAGYEAGILLFLDLLISISAVALGRQGRKNRKKIRHYMENRGITIGVILIIVLLTLFVRGIFLFLEKYS